MLRTCTICRHAQRQEIDRALVSAEPCRGIARRFAVSEDAVGRHKKYLPSKVTRAAERREEKHGNSLLDQVASLTARSQTLLSAVFPEGRNGEKPAISPKDARDVSAVVKEVRENLRLTAQLTGQLKGDGATVNIGIGILASPEWGRVSSAVVGALLPYPDARCAVADALTRLSADTATGTRAEKPAYLLGKPSPSPSGVPIVSSGENPS